MTEYKCGSAKSCKYGEMCKPNYDIGGCSHYREKRPQTNEEWLRTATTEQLAEVLSDFYLMGVSHGINGIDITPRTKFVEWLKQPHKGE